MAINFGVGQFLKASDLNNAFNSVLDLTKTAPQQMVGVLNAPQINASISLSTQDLTVNGDAIFLSIGSLQLPGGTSLQRPNNPAFGKIRWNSDSGLFEGFLSSGKWANFVTIDAVNSQTDPPVNQGGVSFGQASSTSIPLAWTPPGGGTAPFSYTVQFRLAGTSKWITWITNLLATNTTVSGLLSAARYEFQVLSFNTLGNAISPISSTNTLGFLAGGPINLRPFAPTSTTMSLSWAAIVTTLPVAYVVNYAQAGQSIWSSTDPISDTNTTVSGLTSNQSYNFQVVAKTAGSSMESLVVSGITSPTALVAPNAPVQLTATSTTDRTTDLSWSAPTAGTAPFAYQPQIQIGGNPYVNFKTPTTSTSIIITGLTSGVNYFMRVLGINSAGSTASTAIGVTTLSAIGVNGAVSGFQTSGTTFPVISGPQVGIIQTSDTLNLPNITVDDPAAAFAPGSLALTITTSAGTITTTDANGNSIVGSGSQVIGPLSFTFANIQQALSSLSYTAPTTATNDAVRITLVDQFVKTSVLTITMTVNIGSNTNPAPPSAPPGGVGTGGGLITSTGQPTDLNGVQADYMTNALGLFGVGIQQESPNYGSNLSSTTAAILENNINYIGNGNLAIVRALVGQGFSLLQEQQLLGMIAQNCGGLKYILAMDVAALSPFQWQAVLDTIVTFGNAFNANLAAIAGVVRAGGPLPDLTQIAQAAAFQVNVAVAGRELNVDNYPYTTNYSISLGGGTQYSNHGYGYMFPRSAPDLGIAPLGDYQTALAFAGTTAISPTLTATEFGWNSFPDIGAIATANYVAETAQASYLLTTIFKNYLAHIANTTITSGYLIWADLIDNNNKMGLFTAFNGSPRLAATALRATFQILFDTSINATTFTKGKLNYAVTGQPASPATFTNGGYGEALFQRNNGTYVLAMWNEQTQNNASTNALVNVATVPVTVRFLENVMTQVQVFDPLVPYSGFQPTPVQTLNGVSSITVQLPAHPIYLIISHP